ncbi:MAG: hypothetical protein HON43_02865 [Alphaproteobacteria bacterium]|jgi:hypothetical protein|nr:hypothetical protein [Alphaproteobacteria bacterium]MBT5390055.1 hypothetical protein [Alphaproteobacteria bacterium]MBT5540577.1 hypothetical protein [Alphaproteobacteria bacterium]
MGIIKYYFILFLGLFIFAVTEPSYALSKPPNPRTIYQHFGNAPAYGSSDLGFLWFSVFDIALWSEEENWSYDSKFALRIKYNMSFTADEIADTSIDEIKNYYKMSRTEERQYRKILKAAYHNVTEGDSLTAVYTPNNSIRFYHNDRLTKTCTDMEFARKYVDIWLHPQARYTSLREDLLGEE